MTAISISSMPVSGTIQESQPAPLKQANGVTRRPGRAEIKKAAEEFQSLFIEMMLKSMRDTVKQDSLTGGGHGEEVYGSLLDREYAMAISRRGNIGLADMVERQMLMQQEGGTGGPSKVHGAETKASGNIEAYHENR
jgi:Rod binding domain-containing protein